MLATVLAALLAASPAAAEVKNPDTYTFLAISDSDSVDPAWSYDTSSHLAILNVYEPLVAFEGGSLEKVVPLIAEKVPSRANGLLSADGRTYTFPIRKNVKFHDGTALTPEDVRYSLMRFMLYDRDAGPSGLLLQPLTGEHSTRDAAGKIRPGVFAAVSKAVQVKDGAVVITLPRPYAPLLTILASWAVVVSKDWAVKHGDWDGTEATWQKFNNPQKQSSPFFEQAMGSGPFKLERWDRKTKQMLLARNDAYWRGPAKLKRVIIKGINEFSTRKLMLQAGDADSIYAQATERGQLENLSGVRILDDLPMVEMNPVVFFTFKINPVGNPNIGSGKLDGNGIPPDFFTDIDVRKAFAYSFDYAGYIKDARRGRGKQATGAIPDVLPGHNPKQPTFTFDPAKAAEHFKKAWGGKAWDKGFAFTLLYNSGNLERETLAQILKRRVESLNPKFRIDVRPVEWPAFLDQSNASKLPIFVLGWQADFPDPHNFVFELLHSQGNYPKIQKYANPELDKLIDQAIAETDMAKRKALYHKIQALEFQDVPHMVIVDTVRFRTQRDWVQGYVHSPIFPDSPYGSYFHQLWKGDAPKGKR